MLSLEETLTTLRELMRIERNRSQERLDLLNSPLPPGLKDEQEKELADRIAKLQQQLQSVARELTLFPPHHLRHQMKIAEFHQDGTFDKSVFVMTKFPAAHAANGGKDVELTAVITAVRAAVTACGFTPRVASDRRYHPALWDNVELYLLGCNRGIAIVEDKYLPELNPNVSMEWGWMRGMGRDVLYLVEKDFKHERADWNGLIQEPFDWTNPALDIDKAVKGWLPKP
jgi:hypothetical protein